MDRSLLLLVNLLSMGAIFPSAYRKFFVYVSVWLSVLYVNARVRRIKHQHRIFRRTSGQIQFSFFFNAYAEILMQNIPQRIWMVLLATAERLLVFGVRIKAVTCNFWYETTRRKVIQPKNSKIRTNFLFCKYSKALTFQQPSTISTNIFKHLKSVFVSLRSQKWRNVRIFCRNILKVCLFWLVSVPYKRFYPIGLKRFSFSFRRFIWKGKRKLVHPRTKQHIYFFFFGKQGQL